MLLVLSTLAAAIVVAPTESAGAGATARPLFPRFDRAVPVLLYHRLTPSTNGYGVAPADFEQQMQRLHELGFRGISLQQYVRFVRGEPADLPRKPVLITFDDGYISSFDVADPILSRYGWKATVYIPTAAVGTPGRLTWPQLRDMHASGRWQIDEHAGAGHVLIPVDAAGRRLPFYASELWADGERESFDQYKERVSRDIQAGLTALARNIPGWKPPGTFAVPFNDYGQDGSNDPRIEPWLSGYLKAHFSAIFVQRGNGFTRPEPGFENRIHVPGSWDAGSLEAHLIAGARELSPD